MLNFFIDTFSDPQTIFKIIVAIATAATVLTLALPLMERNSIDTRMKAVSVERERIRNREREKLAQRSQRGNLRNQAKPFMKQIVEQFNLSTWLSTEHSKLHLAQAGYRGPQAEVAFLFFRLVTPAALFVLTSIYIFGVSDFNLPGTIRIGAVFFAVYLGIKLPEIVLRNTITKRQFSIRRAFPDALDLLLICVEAGMSIEHALRKVADEIGVQSIPLAAEFTLTMAELSYLPDRRVAYENLALRTDLDSVRQIVTVLIQAERYGTPLGAALRVVSQESRDRRLMEAEKKAAGLPPKLTVPMILFFLPVLFAVILSPAIIQISAMNH